MTKVFNGFLLATHIVTATALAFILPILWEKREETIVAYMLIFKTALILHNAIIVVALVLAGPLVVQNIPVAIAIIVAQVILSSSTLLFSGYLVGVLSDSFILKLRGVKENEE